MRHTEAVRSFPRAILLCDESNTTSFGRVGRPKGKGIFLTVYTYTNQIQLSDPIHTDSQVSLLHTRVIPLKLALVLSNDPMDGHKKMHAQKDATRKNEARPHPSRAVSLKNDDDERCLRL